MKHTKTDLLQMQSLPLAAKIRMTERRIRDWYEYWDGEVYISFSGGKDSTVLLDLVRKNIPDVEAVFVDTGLEYPEIREFVKTFDNVTILRPKMRFDEVIKKYGYPVISKEVAETVQGARKGFQYRIDKLNGAGKYKDGRFSCEKYKPLLDVNFNISHYCCNVMKKSPVKNMRDKLIKKHF